MNNLLILLDSTNCIIKKITDNIYLVNHGFEIIPNEEGLIAFIDWYFDDNNKLLKIDINLLQDYISEELQINFKSNNLDYEHEFNKVIIKLGDIKTISKTKTIYQTFSNSNFIKKNRNITGFLFDLDIIYLENESIKI